MLFLFCFLSGQMIIWNISFVFVFSFDYWVTLCGVQGLFLVLQLVNTFGNVWGTIEDAGDQTWGWPIHKANSLPIALSFWSQKSCFTIRVLICLNTQIFIEDSTPLLVFQAFIKITLRVFHETSQYKSSCVSVLIEKLKTTCQNLFQQLNLWLSTVSCFVFLWGFHVSWLKFLFSHILKKKARNLIPIFT